jgi:hypothetical protein
MILSCTTNSPSHRRISSWHHQQQLPSPPFTTSNPRILFNTSTTRGSRNLKVRNAFHQHVLPWCIDSPGNFLELTMFRGTVHNITHTNHQPQPATRLSNIHHWRGDAATKRWEIIFNIMFGIIMKTNLLDFRFFDTSAPLTIMPPNFKPTPTTNTNRPHGSQIYIIGEGMRQWQGKKAILTSCFAT